MATVPGSGAKTMSTGILALAVKINNREVRLDNLSNQLSQVFNL